MTVAAVLVLGLAGSIVRLEGEHSARRQVEALLAHADARPLQPGEASGAGGRAYLDPETDQVLVVVSGLPPPPANRAYQLWFVRADGRRDSGGLLSLDPQGEATMLARAPAGLRAYTAIGITEEPATGSTAPTGPKLLGASLEAAS